MDNYIRVLHELANVAPYMNFSGYNSITMDSRQYYERSHYRLRVGSMVVDRVLGLGKGLAPEDFGVWTTQDNIDGQMERIRREFETARESGVRVESIRP